MFYKSPSKNQWISFLLFLFVLAPISEADNSTNSYEVTIPEAWKKDISVGMLSIDFNAFYGIVWQFGLYPCVRINLPVENLTSDTLYFNINYRTESKIKNYSNSGMGVCYTLAPNEKRLMDTIAPIASTARPIRFLLKMSKPFRDLDSPAQTTVVVTVDPFDVSRASSKDNNLKVVENEYFDVGKVSLKNSNEQGNCVEFEVKNRTAKELKLGIYIGVNDPNNIESKGAMARPRGFVSDLLEMIPPNRTKEITIPYNIAPDCPNPVLVYSLFIPQTDYFGLKNRDKRQWDIELIGYGRLNLIEAAEQGNCVIPQHLPVDERANLTQQKKSEHFVFWYRPGSYAEKNIDKAISEREAAYEKLREVLKIELPVTVRIDLYPDMEAKALGSGTAWTPANTRNNKHICEVYNNEYQCDSFHELAHIFSYHFPNYSSNKGGIVEAFAAYFEPNNMRIHETKEYVNNQLSEGKLSSLAEVLQSQSSSQQLVVLIDFLLKKDIEKFKEFYVHVTRSRQKDDLDKAAQQVYGTDLNGLEKQWHEYLKNDTGAK